MSDFSKRFLLEDPRRLSPNGRYVALAAFGKHPGWDDHVEDLGLETESLNLAKTLLYVNGIGGQIDTGAWEKLDSSQQIPTFRHLFLWQRAGQLLVGRLWSSSDGKGRTRYPMVVCLHFVGVNLGWALQQALPALEEMEESCRKASSAEEVRSLLARKRAELRQAVQSSPSQGESSPLPPEALHRILNREEEGFLRVLYQIHREMGTFLANKSKGGSSSVLYRAQQVRVPAAGDNPEEALLFWTRFFQALLEPNVPLLLTLALDYNWVDVTAGEPASHEFFALRASPKSMPLVSEVPYNLDEPFRAKAATFLKAFARGDQLTPEIKAAPAMAIQAPAQAKGGWRKWLGLGTLLVLAAGAVLLWQNRQSLSSRFGPAPTNAPAPSAMAASVVPAAAVPAPAAGATADAPRATTPAEPPRVETDAARLAEEKSRSNAMLAAARLKAEAEAAAQQRQRELETAKILAAQKAAAARKAAEDAQAKAPVAVAAAPDAPAPKPQLPNDKPSEPAPARTLAPFNLSAGGELTNSIGMVFVSMPSGIWVGKYEVTQAEYRKVMGALPVDPAKARRPAERIGWAEAKEFCRRLTEMERNLLPAGRVYSLPTDKQWKEFLGGQRFWDLPGGGATGRTEALNVGQAGRANKFGLFDVLGNVWEWCLDGGAGEEKLLKGGAFDSTEYERTWAPGKPLANYGFRCVLVAP